MPRTQMGKYGAFNECWKASCTSVYERKNLDLCFISGKNSGDMDKDMNTTPEMLKVIQKIQE